MARTCGDRKSPNWGYGTPSKWPCFGSYKGVANHLLIGLILQVGGGVPNFQAFCWREGPITRYHSDQEFTPVGNVLFFKGCSELPSYMPGVGFKYFLCSSLPGEMIQFD